MMKVTRNVTIEECPWLSSPTKKGEVVYKYHGPTYGCIGAGIAVTREKGVTPFFELPRDVLEEIK